MSSPRRPRSTPSLRPRSRSRPIPAWARRLENSLAQLRQLQMGQVLERRRRQLFALLLLTIFSSILLLALVPGQRRFEVHLVATRLSFEVALPADEPRRRFLDSIRNLEAFSLTGSYPEPLTLTGQFTSETLGEFTELTVELPYDYSHLQVEPIVEADVDEPSELEVLALQLENQTMVDALAYVPASRRLELQFSHAAPPRSTDGSFLELYLGQQPLRLTLEGYRIAGAGQVLEDPGGNQPETLTFQPDSAKLALPLPQTGTISLSLPSLTNRDTFRWFWGNLPIAKIAFATEVRRGGDSLQRSTIQRGEIQMGEQELEIEADQFLSFAEPGIQQIRYLQLIEDTGIDVRAMGETPLAQVGLDPDFPLHELRSNIMARFFRPDVVVAIVSFSGAMVASLLSWLVDNLFPSVDSES